MVGGRVLQLIYRQMDGMVAYGSRTKATTKATRSTKTTSSTDFPRGGVTEIYGTEAVASNHTRGKIGMMASIPSGATQGVLNSRQKPSPGKVAKNLAGIWGRQPSTITATRTNII